MIGTEQRRQHEYWQERRGRIDSAPFVARARPIIKTIDVRPKPKALPFPMVRMPPRERDWLLISTTPDWCQIVEEVAAKHGTNLHELRSARREKVVVVARQEAMWRLKKETSMTLPAIGRKFGKDHTTVLHSVRRHQARVEAGLA